jgi:hypothetical protein
MNEEHVTTRSDSETSHLSTSWTNFCRAPGSRPL